MGRTCRSRHIPKRGMKRAFRWTLMRHFLFLALSVGGLPGGGFQAGALVFAIALPGASEALLASDPGAAAEAVDVAAVAGGADDDLIAAAGAGIEPETISCQISAAGGWTKTSICETLRAWWLPKGMTTLPRVLSRRLRSLGVTTSGAPPFAGNLILRVTSPTGQ